MKPKSKLKSKKFSAKISEPATLQKVSRRFNEIGLPRKFTDDFPNFSNLFFVYGWILYVKDLPDGIYVDLLDPADKKYRSRSRKTKPID
jgi:hypothetical protein